MTHNNSKQNRPLRHLTWLVAAGLSIALFTGCGFSFGPAFEDDTTSIIKKPEVLSVVLDPPEAAPGDTVTATFLVADSAGALDPSMQLWTLSASGLGASAAVDEGSLDENGGDSGTSDPLAAFDPETTGIFPYFTFTVPSAANYDFDINGMAAQLVNVLVAYDPIDFTQFDETSDLGVTLNEMIATSAAKLVLRTLVVSTRDTRNENPEIVGITGRVGEDGERQELTVVRWNDANLKQSRANAALNAFEVNICASQAKNVPPVDWCPEDLRAWFDVTVEDEGDIDQTIRYQWISTAGDFFSRRDQDQRWGVPCYQNLPENPQRDWSADNWQNIDPREDPNLIPIFLIVRDNGNEDQLAQVWAQFYVRLLLDEGC